ncbi:LacI family DNA-binding transcriptional regulator [Clostridium sp. BNL1100]|uniref:LacI family DNA-binding transcriptional regulator n=1 Tax=Clostridium sp. BNL1100 TaxID=755731 RepID=UPI00024A7A66|nr:LacI family DNA-binding transcriptional regulator [Clostridium sp. BNL1100]AEY66124.1 transcriptional regulator [Clostridium sp. BNL1100]
MITISATIHDIAKRVGIATSTVSRALNGSYGVHPNTIAKVQKAAAELGYVPNLGAKQLVTRKSGLVGVFVPEFDYESIRDADDVLPSVRKALRLYHKDMLIFSVPFYDYQPNSLNEWVQMRNLEGCLFLQPFSKEHLIMKEALKLKIPSVNLGSSLGPKCSLVASDDYEGGKMAGTFLAAQGHCIIGYVDGPVGLDICKERYRGFCEGLHSAGVEHDAALVETGNFSGASGRMAAAALLQKSSQLTAICCANDLMAMGVLLELYNNSISVPEDISVIGYDGTFFSEYTTPPLTTVRHNYESIGNRAADLLVELMNGGSGKSVRYMPRLIIRDSVGKPNRKD